MSVTPALLDERMSCVAGSRSASDGSCAIHFGSRVASHAFTSFVSIAIAQGFSSTRIVRTAAARPCSKSSARRVASLGKPPCDSGGNIARMTAPTPTPNASAATRRVGRMIATITRIASQQGCRSDHRSRSCWRGRCRPSLCARHLARNRDQDLDQACCS